MSPNAPDFLVVGLGGSAGAIPSFREFFRNVPADSGMAYVVILHLSPQHESHLAEVLQASASIPVTQVRETVKVEPDHVYVIPPNKSLALHDGTLSASEMTGFEERRAPVDIFFRTLADTHDSRAVCVIVSGSGADGSMGLRRVKENNGLVLVQDPAEAAFAEMPQAAIATGLADYVVRVAEIPGKIITYRDQMRALPPLLEERADPDEQALNEIFAYLRVRTGHDFTHYKRATVLRRIERRLAVREIAGLAPYAKYLRAHAAEADALLRELLISVTHFFRDRAVFDTVEQTIVPRLLEGKSADDPLRIWVAGCATGEEAYSIAMLVAEATASMASPPDVQIFATDLDEAAIVKARNGYYTVAETADIPPAQLRSYFIKEQDGYRVRRELRELVLFAHHNLIKDPPFSHLDFISCRNVLIYLNRTAQERALQVLHFALEPGGVLLLGTAESVEGQPQLFSVLDKEAHLYQSRAVERVAMQTGAPLTVSAGTCPAGPAEQRPEPRAALAPADLHQRLLEEYAPPSLIVDEQNQILHLTERAGRYLQFSGGEASLNLLQVLRPELRADVRAALFQAARKQTAVAARGIAVHTGERSETVNVIVRPVLRETDLARGFFLVLFEEARESVGTTPRQVTDVEPATRQLEEELIRIKAQMGLTIEQYEVQAEEAGAANEELQATNEELRSTAEELETSQEELQSLNEELQTVNQELKVKIDEITHANDDLRNLMSSTEIGTIFVDRALKVKLFTPRIRDVVNLIPADVGRPLLDIANKLKTSDLAADAAAVLDRLQTIERAVETADGRWHLMRLLPYRTAEDRIDGVVLTFLDITERKRAEEVLQRFSDELERTVAARTAELRETSGMLQSLVEASPLAIVAVDAARKVRTWNAAAETLFGWTAAEAMGRAIGELADLASLFGGDSLLPQARHRRKDGGTVDVHVSTAPLRDDAGNVFASMAVAQAVSERKAREHQREQLLRRIVQSQEEERKRIARELHDQLGQYLTALKIGLETLRPPSDSVTTMKELVARLDRSIDRLTIELRPPVLDDVGLDGAIGSLAEQFTTASGVHADLHLTGSDGERLPAALETTLYRVVQEALTNVWRHANAKNVSVILERHPEQMQLIVEDDGDGFEGPDASTERFGLLGMRERVSLIGGTLNIESAPGRGTTVYVRVPLPAVDPSEP